MTKPTVLGYAYLASPYSYKDPALVQHRFEEAQRATAWLMTRGFVVYSPIVHWHPIATKYKFKTAAADWIEQNQVMLRDAKEGLILLALRGWRESVGVNMEIDWALREGQPIRSMFLAYDDDIKEETFILVSVLSYPRLT